MLKHISPIVRAIVIIILFATAVTFTFFIGSMTIPQFIGCGALLIIAEAIDDMRNSIVERNKEGCKCKSKCSGGCGKDCSC